jgi:hypothetical protein|tara:strand:+ start:1252 stop:1539 length:288 start_codon:yes stop_codon:yes gene_type:complete
MADPFTAIAMAYMAYSAKRGVDESVKQTEVMGEQADEATAQREKMEKLEKLKGKLRKEGVQEVAMKPKIDQPYAGQGYTPMSIKRRLTVDTGANV